MWETVSNLSFPNGESVVSFALSRFGSFIVQVLLSTTFFAVLLKLLTLIGHIDIVKRLFLMKDYVDGYWVGFFIKTSLDANGVVQKSERFVVERIKQSATDIIITGRSYELNLPGYREKSRWSSSNFPTQVKGDKIIFGYEDTFLNDEDLGPENENKIGFCFYDLTTSITDDSRIDIPRAMSGYFINLRATEKVSIHTVRVDVSYDEYKKNCKKNNKAFLTKEEYHIELAIKMHKLHVS